LTTPSRQEKGFVKKKAQVTGQPRRGKSELMGSHKINLSAKNLRRSRKATNAKKKGLVSSDMKWGGRSSQGKRAAAERDSTKEKKRKRATAPMSRRRGGPDHKVRRQRHRKN